MIPRVLFAITALAVLVMLCVGYFALRSSQFDPEAAKRTNYLQCLQIPPPEDEHLRAAVADFFEQQRPSPAPGETPDCERRYVAHFVSAGDGATLARGELRVLHASPDPAGAIMIGPAGATFDAGGSIELCLPESGAGFHVTDVPGRSPTILLPVIDATASAPPEFALARSAALELHVDDRSAAAGALTARVEVDAPALAAREQLGRYTPHGPLAWSGGVVAGEASLDDLPSDAALRLTLHRGGKTVYEHGERLILAPGEERTLELSFGAGTELTVHVVDENERPVADRRVGLAQRGIEARAGDEDALLLSNTKPEFVLEARTDADGKCVFASVPPGTWWVGLAPTRAPWDAYDADAVTPVARRVELPGSEVARELTLRTWRGLYIRGRVEVPDGRLFEPGAGADASPNVFLIAHRSGRADGLTGQPDRSGEFALGPVTDAEYVIETFARDYAPIEPIRARASDGPIVIRMQLGARVFGHVVDAATGAGVQSEVVLTPIGSALPEIAGSTDGAGSFGFSGLAAGEYVVAAFAPDGRTGASARCSAAPGTPIEDLVARLAPPASSGRVKLVLSGTIEPGRITLWEGEVCRALYFVDGPCVRIVGAPPGTLEARLVLGEVCVARKPVEVVPGNETELRFER